MSSDLLRRAAKEMREKAEAAVLACGDEPWLFDYGYPGYDVSNSVGVAVVENGTEETAEHIASWHPAVALVVADWLDNEAGHYDASVKGLDVRPEQAESAYSFPLAVARAYLGESA